MRQLAQQNPQALKQLLAILFRIQAFTDAMKNHWVQSEKRHPQIKVFRYEDVLIQQVKTVMNKTIPLQILKIDSHNCLLMIKPTLAFNLAAECFGAPHEVAEHTVNEMRIPSPYYRYGDKSFIANYNNTPDEHGYFRISGYRSSNIGSKQIDQDAEICDLIRLEAANLYATGNLSAAENTFKLLVQLFPQDAMTHQNLAFLLLQQSNIEPALQHANQAVSLDSDSDLLFFTKALILLQKDPLSSEAEDCLQQALSLNPNNNAVRNALIEYYNNQGASEKANALKVGQKEEVQR
jgi:tetratricopeptide (TPR) repeat protein